MKHQDCINSGNSLKKGLNAYSLAGIGIGGIIGAGFFLGSSIAINHAGPSVILAFLLGGIIMSQVLGAMTSISINRPVQGSFRVYTEEFLGKFTGYLLGWTIFVSGILSISSEAIAAGIFMRYWFKSIPLFIFAMITLIIVMGINGLGTKYFGFIESSMAMVKIICLIIFIVLGVFFITKNWDTTNQNVFHSLHSFFPNKITGFFQSMLIVVFTFSGISTVAMATSEVKRPCYEIPKATVLLTFGIVILYVVSMFVVVSIVKWNLINLTLSPFVQTFNKMGYGWASVLTNGIILIATISVMGGTYYGCMQILVSLSSAKEAPKLFSITNRKGFYKSAWLAIALFGAIVVVSSFFLGTKLFSYLISASSYFSFFNWIVNFITYLKWLNKKIETDIYKSPLIKGRYGAIGTIIVIIILIVLSLQVADFRVGFYIALGVLSLISLSYKLILDKE